MFKVAIIGGEKTNDYPKFKKKCIQCLKNKVKEDSIMIYTIGDRFVDAFSERYSIPTRFFPCDFKTFGKDALKVRAEYLMEDVDALIAFNYKNNKDASYFVNLANEKGIPVRTPFII